MPKRHSRRPAGGLFTDAGDSASGRQKGPGGGCRALTARDPALADASDKLMEPCTSGDPMRPPRRSCKSTGQLARELTRQGHPVSAEADGRLLKAEGGSLQGSRRNKIGHRMFRRITRNLAGPPAGQPRGDY